MDAFLKSLPLLQGEGAHPPADACDFARYCSALDFFSINDHAEGLTPAQWGETVESIRQCNAVAGDPASPDMVAFLGWEWTQMGTTPADHYGHKNVIVRGLDDDEIPARPIAAAGYSFDAMRQSGGNAAGLAMTLADFGNRQRYFDFTEKRREVREAPAVRVGDRHALASRGLRRERVDASRAVREARPVGLRVAGDSARKRLGQHDARRHLLGQAARERQTTTPRARR